MILISRICKNNTDVKYSSADEDDPSVPSWDDPITNEEAVQ